MMEEPSAASPSRLIDRDVYVCCGSCCRPSDNAGVLSYLLATTSASGNQSGGVHAMYASCIKLAQRRAKEESVASMFF